MDKKQLLKELSAAVRSGTVSRQEALSAIDDRGGKEASLILPHRSLNMAEILAALGGGIVFIGIIILVAQHWAELGSLARVLITLGGACVAYVIGAFFSIDQDPRRQLVAQAFFLIFGLVLPIGVAVSFHEGGFLTSTSPVQTMMSLIIAAANIVSYMVFRKQLFVFFAIAGSTWFVYAVVAMLMRNQAGIDVAEVFEYLTLVMGIAYIALGYGWRGTRLEGMTNYLYCVGLIGLLGAAMALGGYAPDQNVFWELALPALALWAIFLSTFLKSRAFIIIGTLYLMIDIVKITAEYFSDSLGWPLALVIAGLGLIVVGSFTWKFQKRI